MNGAARALEQAGLLGKIKRTGLAPASLLKRYIEGGSVQDVWWNVKDLGYLTYYGAKAYAQCKITGKPGETFTAGRLGEFTTGEDVETVLGPAQIVTDKNIDVFKFQGAAVVPPLSSHWPGDAWRLRAFSCASTARIGGDVLAPSFGSGSGRSHGWNGAILVVAGQFAEDVVSISPTAGTGPDCNGCWRLGFPRGPGPALAD